MPATELPSMLSLIVDTPTGIHLRRVPDATRLIAGVDRGAAAEDATRNAVARWGLPDFIYRPVVRRVGSGTRELGDGVLLVGNRAAVVQVKSRQISEDGPNKEENWVVKNATKALKQAKGTVRSLRSAPAVMVNLRGREITVDGQLYDWLSVIIIDHPQCPTGVTVTNPFADLPAVVLTRRDWEFLFTQLRSTHAVVEYLFRVSDHEPISLGEEPVRYYQLAQADEEAAPGQVAPEILAGGTAFSAPLLSKEPAGRGDSHAHTLLRIMMEDIATSPLSDHVTELDRTQVLAELDQLPVQTRADLGRLMLSALQQAAATPYGSTLWRSRRFRFSASKPQLIFATCTGFSEAIRSMFSGLVMLRHHEFCEDLGTTDGVVSVGVLLTPRHDGLRPWDTSMTRVSGGLEFEPGELELFKEQWNRSRVVRPPAKPKPKKPAKRKPKPKRRHRQK